MGYRYVAVINQIDNEEGELTVTFMKICNDKGHTFRVDDADVSDVTFDQILEKLPNPDLTLKVTNFLARDSPLVETVDTVYGRIVASGIEAKYTADNNVVQQYLISKRQWLTKTEQRLSLRHMQACFTVMALGSLVSVLVFIAELLWNRRGL